MGRYIKTLYFVDGKEFKDAEEGTTFRNRKRSVNRLKSVKGKGTELNNYKAI